ncbi:MAG: hypothetical protein J5496_06590 [Lachnospiraceae bacterium]|nr:hypothetical protein [Lachnospiraceae bacterium]
MRLFPRYLSHDEAFSYAKKLAAGLSQEQLARDFLYGLAHNEAAYRTALPVWFYIKNLPEHAFSPFTTLTPSGKVKVYYDKACSFCNYQHKSDDVPKMEFLKINTVLCQFYFDGGRIWGLRDLGRAIIFLEEYLRLPRPSCRQEDYTFFQKLIEEIESAPPETTARGLQILWKKAGLLSMTKKQTDLFIDALGYLNILHTADTVGIREKFVADLDMPYPLSSRTYFDYPVNCWKRSDGIDYQSIKTLFENLY